MEFFNLLMRGQVPLVEAAYLVCLFWIVAAKPERISGRGKFRLACSLFAVELVVPAILNLYYFGGSVLGETAAAREQNLGLGMWLSTIGPLLLMSSFLLAINSIMPARKTG